MKRIQTRLMALLAAALLTTGFSAQAQETPQNYVGYPYLFFGLQGGVQETGTKTYNNWKLFTPTASASVGMHFTPVFAARLHVNGIWNKGGIRYFDRGEKSMTYKFKYATTDIDAMFNLVNLFSKNDYHPLNIYLIGGIGLNYAWDTETFPQLRRYVKTSDSDNRFSHNFRVGAMADLKVARIWSVNVELDANSLNDRFNSKIHGCDDWQFVAQLGVTYKFGLRHKVKEAPNSNIIVDPSTIGAGTETASANTNVAIEKPEATPAPKPEPTPTPAPVVKDITRNIFFGLRETTVTPAEQAKLKEVADWLKEHPTAKATVTGYADKGTGNANSNARYAKQRAEAVTNILTKKYGIAANRITTSSKGDTVQPFPTDNDKNRVTVIVGKE